MIIHFKTDPKFDRAIKFIKSKGFPFATTIIKYAVYELEREMGGKQNPKDAERDEQVSVCEQLGGKISENGLNCTYTCYEKDFGGVNSYEDTIPLSHLTEEHLKLQYKPDKETCIKAMEEEK